MENNDTPKDVEARTDVPAVSAETGPRFSSAEELDEWTKSFWEPTPADKMDQALGHDTGS